MDKINLARLHFVFCATKDTRLKEKPGANWDQKITSLLEPLPKTYTLPNGLGKITGIRLNHEKSKVNKLVFTFQHTGRASNTYDVIIAACLSFSFTMNLIGGGKKRDKSVESHITSFFLIHFYHEQYDFSDMD